MNEEPRAYTPEELRDLLLGEMRVLARFWANLEGEQTVLERIEGAMFSVLSILDGAHGMCAFDLVARVDSTDKQYHIENEENWIEDGTKLAFMLHDHWHKPKAKAQKHPDSKGVKFNQCRLNPVGCDDCGTYLGTCLHIPLTKIFDISKEGRPTIIWSNEELHVNCPKCGKHKIVAGTKGHSFWMENIIKELLEENPCIEL